MLLTSKYLNFLARTNKFDNVSVDFLIDSAKDKNEMANLIIKKRKFLNYLEIEKLLKYATDKDEFIEFIIKYANYPLGVGHLLPYAIDKDKVGNFIVKNKKKLSLELF